MPTVYIPPLMRDLTEGKDRVTVEGRTVGEVIDSLENIYPGVKDRLCEGGKVRREIAISVDGNLVRLERKERINELSEIRFNQIFSGG